MPPQRPAPEPVELEPQPGTVSGLGLIVETTLVRFIQRAVNSIAGLISEVIELGLEVFFEVSEEALIRTNRGMIEYIIGLLPDDSPLAVYFREMLTPGSFVGAATLGGFASSMGSSAAGNLLGVMMRPLGYELDSLLHTARMDPSLIIGAWFRGLVTEDELKDQLGDLGWSPEVVDIWRTMIRPLLSERDIVALWIRGDLGETEGRERLRKRGYGEDTIEQMFTLMHPLTGMGELRELRNRGIISPDAFGGRLRQHGYQRDQVNELLELSWSLLGAGDIVELHRRGQLSDAEIIQRLRDHGYSEERVAEIVEVGRPLTNLGEIVSLHYRQLLDGAAVRARFSEHGYSEEQIEEFLELANLIPGPGDLVSMAVREAFRPDLIEEYNYLAEFPAEFAQWMTKQGYSEEWAQRYWVAHWRLPSLTMAYEMLHRRIIDEEEMDRLFAVSDIAPYWRQPLKDAAYRPLTRVDVRRMYGMGVLDREGVFNSYLDLGYNAENAELMTEFTIRYESTEDREGTKTDILRAYSAGVMSRSDAKDDLTGIGYVEDWAELYLLLEELKRAEALLKTEVDIMEDQYIDGMISRSDVYQQLGEWDLPSTQIENYLEAWDIKKRRKVSIPSIAKLELHLKMGVITEGEYRETMARRHYEAATIENFLQEIRIEIAEDALKEEERARAEEDRLTRTEIKTEYDQTRATLDVQIAQLKVAIAENKVLMGTLLDVELIDQLGQQNLELAEGIRRLEEGKARAKLAYTEQLEGIG